MRGLSQSAVLPLLMPPPRLNIWQWAERSVDYSRVRNYDTEWKGPYRADYMPYWREPMEALTDPTCREVWVLKCSRSGGSENALLTPLRYVVATAPQPVLYMSGQEGATGKFMETRIKPGFALAPDTAARYAVARVREYEIMFDSMDLIATWPANRMAFKQSGFSLILADEVSTWPEVATDMLRERQANYSFPHLVGISSPDPAQKRSSDEDPIFLEYGQTDKRKWHCADPKTGNPFVFRLGTDESVDGLKWDKASRQEDGTWDLNAVAATAHYVTPDGTRIDERDRMEIVRAGKWIATSDKGIMGRLGYHVTRFMVPFSVGSFGHIAVKFLEAKHKGMSAGATNRTALRTFFYEYLAEPFYDTKEEAAEGVILDREADYRRGDRVSDSAEFKPVYIARQKEVMGAVDVQKDTLWFAAREYVDGGDSGLIDWRHAVTWADIDKAVSECRVDCLGIDFGYDLRAMEVFDYAAKTTAGNNGIQWVLPLKGVDNLSDAVVRQSRDAYEGKKGGGRGVMVEVYNWKTHVFRLLMMQLMRGESAQKWRVYRGIEREYAKQVTAQECRDGVWQFRAGHSQDHLWDCECMMLVLARVRQLYRSEFLTEGVQ